MNIDGLYKFKFTIRIQFQIMKKVIKTKTDKLFTDITDQVSNFTKIWDNQDW